MLGAFNFSVLDLNPWVGGSSPPWCSGRGPHFLVKEHNNQSFILLLRLSLVLDGPSAKLLMY